MASSLTPTDFSIRVDHGTLNIVSGNQMNLLPDSHQASPQPLSLQTGNHAPLDLLSIHFTGRGKDLEFLQEALSMSRSDIPSRCVVYGMPGLGKTQLMLRYAKISFDQQRYSHIFWISATSTDKLNQGIAGILDLVGYRDHHHHDQKAKLTAVRLWLEGTLVDWLLILDNVNRTTLDFLREHLPRKNKRGNVLFTTRTADIAEALVNAAGEQHPMLRLQALDLRDTANLFFQDAGINSETVTPSEIVQAEDLVKYVGCLPLAVVQAASFMRQTETSLTEMLELYKGKERIEAIRWGNDLSSYEEQSVAATFTRLLDQLNLESRDASNLLKVLSFYDPESIPLEIFDAGADQWLRGKDESRHTPFQPASTMSQEISSMITLILSPIQFKIAIQKLQRLSLVERRLSVEKPSLWMHDLVQFLMQEGARKEEAYRDWLQLSALLVCGALRQIDDPELPERRIEFEKFLPHLRSLNSRWDDAHDTQLELSQANVKMAVYLTNRGRYDEAKELLERALATMEKHLSGNHLDILWCASVLANVYRLQGQLDKAVTLNKRALAGRETQLGADHLDTLWSMNALAIVYRLKGRLHDAETLHKQAMAGREKQLGANHPDTLWSMGDLASVYRRQGRFDKAEELHKRTLVIMEEQLGANHPNTLWSMGALANVYRFQGRFDEAGNLLKQVLEGREKQLGADHPDTLGSMGGLANVYRLQGRFEEAEKLYKLVLVGMEKQCVVDHPNMLWFMGGLAAVYESQGCSKEAEELHKQVLEGRGKQLGVDHPNTLWSIANLANVYGSQGRFSEAEELHKQALAGREKRLGVNHPDTLSSVTSLANVYRLQKRFSEAEELERRTSASRDMLTTSSHK